MENFLAPYRQPLLSVFRIMAGLLVLQYGAAKIIRFPAVQMFANVAVGQWPTWYAGVIELICGTLLVIGPFSRISAFVLSGLMAFAYFIRHAPRGIFSPLANNGTLAILFCFTFRPPVRARGAPTLPYAANSSRQARACGITVDAKHRTGRYY
jgi:putative oxidoreductase